MSANGPAAPTGPTGPAGLAGLAAGRRFAGLVTALFVLATLPRLLAHELWRDEAWLWLVVTQARSLADLVEPLGRSGQGYLFPLLAYAVAEVWESPRALQILHLALAGGATFVFVRWAPFGRAERLLFVFGYFPFYEYAVISRHYVLGLLLLWLACLAAEHRRRWTPLALGASLGLLCQTTVYGFLLALAIGAGLLARRALAGGPARFCLPSGGSGSAGSSNGGRGSERPRRDRRRFPPASAAGLLLAVAGAAAGVVQLVPASGTSFAPGWRFGWDAAHAIQVLGAPWRAAVPLPRPAASWSMPFSANVQFWNSNVLDAWPALQALGGVAVLVLAVALLWPRRVALATFCLGAAGLLAFAYVKFPGTLRHQGHWWLLAAAALWLAGGLPERPAVGARAWRRWTIRAFLFVHCVAALFASVADLRHPFSSAGRTAEVLRRTELDRLPLLGWREPPAASVALALGAPLYAPSRGVYTTHPDWGPLQRELTFEELRCIARRLAADEASDVGLVVNRELPPWEEIEAVASIRGAIAASEDYHLYRLDRSLLAATAGAAACDLVPP